MLPSSVVINYKYDALGRRVERSKSDGTWTRYSYDGLEVLRDVHSDGSTVEYVNGDELDDHLWQRKSDGTTQFFLTDHQGSTRALADASGAVTASYSYDTFGNGFSGTATRFGYTGREHDSETGLMYYRARWYDPGTGRFVSEDPIGLAGGMNFYGYIGNDPTNWIDPVGLFDKGNFKPKLSTKVKIGRGLGVLGALFLAWEIWDSVNQGGPRPLPLPQATPTPAPSPKPQAGASGSAAGNGNCSTCPCWSSTKKGTSVENAFGHWQKHGKEFPEFQNAKEYVQFAKQFINNPPNLAHFKFRPNGEKVVYDPASNIFAVGKPGPGNTFIPRTMFRPDPAQHKCPTNLDYFNAQ